MSKKIAPVSDYLSIDALEITLTGPFQISDPLDFSQTKAEEYQTKQETVKERMEELFPQYCWEIPESGGGQKYEMGSGGTGKAHSPPYYLECLIECDKIKCDLKKYIFIIKELKVKFYEFGFATVSVSGVISSEFCNKASKQKIQSNDLLSTVDELDDKIVKGEIRQIKVLISRLAKRFIKTVRENNINEFFDRKKTPGKKADISIRNIKSLHRIYKYKVNKNSEIIDAQKALNKITKLSNGKWKKENSFSHFAGAANSAIVYNCNIVSQRKNIDSKIFDRYDKAYKTVLETANAYYFIAEFIKNGLFDYSRESVVIQKSKRFLKMSRKTENILNEHIVLTSNFLSVSDEFKINLGPQGKNIWGEIDKVWNASKTTKMLEDQLQNSLLITDRVLKQEANKWQRVLNYLAIIFTSTGAIALVEISQSTGFHWKFDMDIWHFDGWGDFTSKAVNFAGSSLALVFAISLSLAILILLVCFIFKVLNWVFRVSKNLYYRFFHR